MYTGALLSLQEFSLVSCVTPSDLCRNPIRSFREIIEYSVLLHRVMFHGSVIKSDTQKAEVLSEEVFVTVEITVIRTH